MEAAAVVVMEVAVLAVATRHLGEQLGRRRLADVLVDEDLERLLHRLVEDRVPLEAALLGPRADELGVLVVDVQQLLDVRHQVGLLVVGLRRLPLDEREADVLDVLAHDVADRREAGGDPREEAVHPREVVGLVVAEERLAAAVLLLEERGLGHLRAGWVAGGG